MKKKRFALQVNIFEFIYFFISIATFPHTVWSGSFSYDGLRIDNSKLWYIAGILMAITIDFGMFICARLLAKKFSIVIAIAFLVAALASFYTQLLYVLYHSTEWSWGTGVSSYWVETLRPFVDARVLLVPLSLPLFGLIYSFAKRENEKNIVESNKPVTMINGVELVGEVFDFNGHMLEKYQDVNGLFYIKIPKTQKIAGPYQSMNRALGALSAAATRKDKKEA